MGCVVPIVIWPEFHLGQYRDGDHGEDASHFNISRSGNTPFFPNSNAKNGIETLSVKGLDTFNSTYGNAYKVS